MGDAPSYKDARGIAPRPEGAPTAAEAIRQGRDSAPHHHEELLERARGEMRPLQVMGLATAVKVISDLTEALASVQAERDRSTIREEAAREAAEDLAERYGATVEWDEEGTPCLAMPTPAATRREEALRKAVDAAQQAVDDAETGDEQYGVGEPIQEAVADEGGLSDEVAEVAARIALSAVRRTLEPVREALAALATTPEPPPAPEPLEKWGPDLNWEEVVKHPRVAAPPSSSREDDAR